MTLDGLTVDALGYGEPWVALSWASGVAERRKRIAFELTRPKTAQRRVQTRAANKRYAEKRRATPELRAQDCERKRLWRIARKAKSS